jgi:type I restriction-modification system DNA methylase subunit
MSLSSFIWSVADLLRGDYKQSECGKVIPWHFYVFSRRAEGRHG